MIGKMLNEAIAEEESHKRELKKQYDDWLPGQSTLSVAGLTEAVLRRMILEDVRKRVREAIDKVSVESEIDGGMLLVDDLLRELGL